MSYLWQSGLRYVSSLCMLAVLTSAAAAEVAVLNEETSRCAMFRALSPEVPAECAIRSRGVVFNTPQAGPADRPVYGFTTTRIQFAFDSSQLTFASQQLLDTLAEVLQEARLAEKIIRIEGHTDSSGAALYNQHLSQRRALAVQRYLHERHSIALRRLLVVGKGEDELYDMQHPTAAVNRRVQFVNLSDSQEQK